MEGMRNIAVVRQSGEETRFEAPEGYHIHIRLEGMGLVEVMARKKTGTHSFSLYPLASITGDSIITQEWVKVS